MRSGKRRKKNVLELNCLRCLVEVSQMDRVGNKEVSRRAVIKMELWRVEWIREFGTVSTRGENG